MSSRAEESNTEWLMGVMCTFYALAIFSVCLRMYTRLVVVKSPGLDDYFMVAAAACATVGMATHGVQSQNGMGKHYEFITPPMRVEYSKFGFFQSIINNTGGISILKVSIALSLLKLGGGNRAYTNTLYAFLALTAAVTIYAWCTLIFFCDPVHGYWDKTINPKCYDIKLFVVFGLVHTAVNMFTDVAFALLPIPIIWMLQMKKRTKIYLCIVLSLGLIAVVMGVLKATYQIKHGGDRDVAFMHGVQFWAFLQLNTGIIAACAPTLKPLLGRTLHLGSTAKPRSYGNSSSAMYFDSKGNNRSRSNRGYINHTDNDEVDIELSRTSRQILGGGVGSFHAGAVGGAEALRQQQQQHGGGSSSASKGADSQSEEFILQGTAEGGILRTTEISIQR
ncbi:hypothetical protein MCOR27_003487 [Pyricularia oryzae]|uniref:Rhodopsin domain-containing protein n=3 Tax=Pyricularia oryzae TaxID=318829 RepID=G4NA87_PYRO7|nr:uncharacterized protein MGG_13946 [Pyricularia oryzae 70-15]ELQ36872.1 hypothetical protein OOU_Y34scaffold00628g16 [Pyricularia oryzae Y34]KAH8844630.1 hypothetical protein MCOR01_005362 [Pyricularia oryzae]EHA49637.1 hypothetical protein MGG_13946 [Pyricularia oryzae 70-15]KAI6263273.1 hypothetical protein MCOR19_000599 [Pyricularia oryzae]KAI6282978.1 hypothetical protein MCOR27_003487 [Pyricularia oryzae]